jgi:hypothetical protein
VLPDLVGGEVVDVGLAGLDQVYGPVVELVEVVGGEVEMLAPVEAEPADVFLDRVDVLLLFLDRVGVVEAQVAAAAELLGDPEVERDRLGWPRWRYPFGSGGKRVTTSETLPSRTSAATISPMKSRRSGEAGAPALTGCCSSSRSA